MKPIYKLLLALLAIAMAAGLGRSIYRKLTTGNTDENTIIVSTTFLKVGDKNVFVTDPFPGSKVADIYISSGNVRTVSAAGKYWDQIIETTAIGNWPDAMLVAVYSGSQRVALDCNGYKPAGTEPRQHFECFMPGEDPFGE